MQTFSISLIVLFSQAWPAEAFVWDFIKALICFIPFVNFLLPFCSPPSPTIADTFEATIYPNPIDGRIFSLVYEGVRSTIQGSFGKDVDVPLQLVTENNDDGTSTTFELDATANTMIERMVTKDTDGNLGFFNLELTDGDELLISLDFPALSYRGYFALEDFSTNNDTEVFSTATSKGLSPKSSFTRLKRDHQNRKDRQLSRFNQGRQLQSNPGFVDIFIVECLRNVDPAFLEVTAVSDGENVPVAYERLSEGHYRAFLALQEAENISEDILDAVCFAISRVGAVCPVVIAAGVFGRIGLCSTISAGVAATGVGAAAAPAVFSACSTGLTAAATFCAAYELAGGGLPPGSPNAIDIACEALADGAGIIEDLNFPESVTVTARANLPTGDFVSGSSTWQPENGQFGPSIELEGPGTPELVSFEAIPSNPIECQSYTAFANIACETESTGIVMSIEGTDGYSDSTSCTATSGCSLGVPGAEAGVVDTITVQISANEIGTIFEVIGLFFRASGASGGCGGRLRS